MLNFFVFKYELVFTPAFLRISALQDISDNKKYLTKYMHPYLLVRHNKHPHMNLEMGLYAPMFNIKIEKKYGSCRRKSVTNDYLVYYNLNWNVFINEEA